MNFEMQSTFILCSGPDTGIYIFSHRDISYGNMGQSNGSGGENEIITHRVSYYITTKAG
jgi:hypothetical protein